VSLSLVFTLLLVALVFEYINGFHDTANSIATVVATKVLTPGQAVLLAAFTNLLGATIWDLITWWWGLPSSSSHALIGGLVGAAFAAANENWHVVIWSVPGEHWWVGKGILNKVILPMVVSPAAGFLLGFTIMGSLFALLSFLSSRGGAIQRAARPRVVNAIFAKVQMFSSGFMGFSHGLNDAQKTMGIIALALASATSAGSLDHLPGWLNFLRIDADAKGQFEIATWIKATCAVVMAMGTMAGGWRIIRTLGHKMVKLHPINGVAADIASSSVIVTASALGIPVSTTHNVSSAIMGVGAAKRLNAIKWTVVERMVWAWILTIPISGALAYFLVRALKLMGWV